MFPMHLWYRICAFTLKDVSVILTSFIHSLIGGISHPSSEHLFSACFVPGKALAVEEGEGVGSSRKDIYFDWGIQGGP